MFRIRDLKGILEALNQTHRTGAERLPTLQSNSGGDQDWDTPAGRAHSKSEKVPGRGAGEAAGGLHGCRATAAGLVFGAVAQGQGQPSGPGGGVRGTGRLFLLH